MPNASINKKFGDRVRELRLATKMNQETFAEHCGFARTYMSRIETGGANPSLDAIQVIAVGLNIELSELFKGI